MMEKKSKQSWLTKRLLLGSVMLLGLLLIVGAYVTHGIFWSVYVPIYGRLLDSVPTPSGFLSESSWTVLLPEYPCGERGYEVDKNQAGLVNFYITELPRAGWDLTEHNSRESRVAVTDASFEYLNYDKLVFVNQQRYWLSVLTFAYTDGDGVQVRDSEVFLGVCRDEEWKNLGH